MTSQSLDHEKKVLREFGLMFSAIVVVLFWLFFPWVFEYARPLWLLIIAGLLTLIALAAPIALKYPYQGWMKFAAVLGFINTRIIMFFIFYFVFFPMGVMMWLVRYDPMHRRQSDEPSFRHESTVRPSDSMEKPY